MEFRFSLYQAVYLTLVFQDRLLILTAASYQRYGHINDLCLWIFKRQCTFYSQGLEETQ